jgi:RNA polymerase sigma factor (sigma-70 family)
MSEAHDAITKVWKSEAARVVGVLARVVRDIDRAEELAQDALVAALEEWPRTGVPDRPGAWLVTTAKNRALNALRHARVMDRKQDAIAHETRAHIAIETLEAMFEAAMDEDIADDVLRLIFIACHPLLSREAHVALTLRLVGGLSTSEIARAFLVPEPTIAQRIVRAKRTLAGVAYEMPRGDELAERLASVLEVVYLVFNVGYLATTGDLMRPTLVEDALRLGRLLAELAPNEPEAHALLALMELQASRSSTRTDASGEPVLLMDQDRTQWDRALITSGLDALAQAESSGRAPGRYRLQAAIAACHARAPTAEDTDWKRIAHLYGDLLRLVPSPVIALNRAVAVSRAEGPDAGLALLDALAKEGTLARYHLLPAARADLLEKLGRIDEARSELEHAASLAENPHQKKRLLARLAKTHG